MSQFNLQEYLLNRGFTLTEVKDMTILEDESLINSVAEAWKSHKPAITAVLQRRISHIRDELITSASPYEVLPLRQALAELATVIDDFEKLSEEVANRSKEEESKTQVAEEVDTE